MTVSIALIGLGRVGASLGLALAGNEEVRLAGFDPEPDAAREAQRLGAVRKPNNNLNTALNGVDLVVLTGRLAEQRDWLPAVLAPLRDGGVVVCLAGLLGPALAWAQEALPAAPGRHLVACHPVLNPAVLHTGDVGPAAADASLFRGGLWTLAPAPGCAPEALKLVADLARLVDAEPYFVDPVEHDGLAAATEALPAVLGWALLRAASASPGWPEARKLADRSFATATAALADADPETLRLNRDNVLYYLDAALAELSTLRGRLAAGDAAVLAGLIEEAAEQQGTWLAERRKGDWDAGERLDLDIPTAGDVLSRLLLGRFFGRKRDE